MNLHDSQGKECKTLHPVQFHPRRSYSWITDVLRSTTEKSNCYRELKFNGEVDTEGYVTLNLLPVYRYGHPLSIDTKVSTNH